MSHAAYTKIHHWPNLKAKETFQNLAFVINEISFY